MKVPE